MCIFLCLIFAVICQVFFLDLNPKISPKFSSFAHPLDNPKDVKRCMIQNIHRHPNVSRQFVFWCFLGLSRLSLGLVDHTARGIVMETRRMRKASPNEEGGSGEGEVDGERMGDDTVAASISNEAEMKIGRNCLLYASKLSMWYTVRTLFHAPFSIVTLKGAKYLLGVQIARMLKRKTFNLYHCMKKKRIELRRATREQLNYFQSVGAVTSGTHSVTFVPYADGLCFIADALYRYVRFPNEIPSYATKKRPSYVAEKHKIHRRKPLPWDVHRSIRKEEIDGESEKNDEGECEEEGWKEGRERSIRGRERRGRSIGRRERVEREM